MTTAVMPVDLTAADLSTMLRTGSQDTFTTTSEAVGNFLGPLLMAGLPLLPLAPNDKAPHSIVAHGVHSATPAIKGGWEEWLIEMFKPLGNNAAGTPLLGVGIAMGRVVVFDADTPEEVASLRAFFPTVGIPADTPPTVQTPGTEDGKHSEGGHWYVLLPSGYSLPRGLSGVVKVGDGDNPASLMLASRYVVLPFTHRNGGMYTVSGEVLELTEGLRDFLEKRANRVEADRAAANKRRDAASSRAPEEQEALDAWRADTDWSDILEPAGWTLASADGTCGCGRWQRPGGTHAYSAVAHDCGRGTYFHVYSDGVDNIDSEESLSKEMTYARVHEMDYAAVMADVVGVPPVTQVLPAPEAPAPQVDAATLLTDRVTGLRPDVAASVAVLVGADEVVRDIDNLVAMGALGLEALARRLGKLAAEAYDGATNISYTADNFDVIGAGGSMADLYTMTTEKPVHGSLFYKTGLHVLAGPGGCGKTWAALGAMIPPLFPEQAWTRQTDTRHSVYLDMDHNGFPRLARRLAALGCGPERMERRDVRLAAPPTTAHLDAMLLALLEAPNLPEVIVFDSLTQLMADLDTDTNSDRDVTAALRRFIPLSEKTCVIVVDHVGKADGDAPRGSSAKVDAVDVVLTLKKRTPDPDSYPNSKLTNLVHITKDRHSGIIEELCAPGDPQHGGVWTLDVVGPDHPLPGGAAPEPGREVRVIPAWKSAEKRELEAAEKHAVEAESIPQQVAEAVRKAGGSVDTNSELVSMLRAGDFAMTKRNATEAVKLAVEANAVIAEKKPGNRTSYRVA